LYTQAVPAWWVLTMDHTDTQLIFTSCHYQCFSSNFMIQLKLPSSKEDLTKFGHKKDMKGNILKMLLYCRLPTVTYNSNLADLIVLWNLANSGHFYYNHLLYNKVRVFWFKTSNFWSKNSVIKIHHGGWIFPGPKLVSFLNQSYDLLNCRKIFVAIRYCHLWQYWQFYRWKLLLSHFVFQVWLVANVVTQLRLNQHMWLKFLHEVKPTQSLFKSNKWQQWQVNNSKCPWSGYNENNHDQKQW
jgi:hypothetical protein